MAKINLNWCKKQEKGISLVEPNTNLSEDYLKSAQETLLLLKDVHNKSNMWAATMKYYCEYFAVYSFLIRVGIKCEIHDCTIKLVELFEEQKMLPKGTFQRLDKDKGLRIDNQYYLKNLKVNIDFNDLSDFVLAMKNRISSITLEEIKKIRAMV
ncbi:MAG: hypothetical protein PHH54_05955 [Candidatus Nanoarchaeia archaeon]|nr:hypothetical protein [Candidatus Nanoarchaeia archaeon]MDD5741498.1 hypothetical protein [Candidatus Nanoarchaeia archaeon]